MIAAKVANGADAEPLLGWSDGAEASRETCWHKARHGVTSLARAAWNNGLFCLNAAMLVNSTLWLATKRLAIMHVPVFQTLFFRGVVGFLIMVTLSKVMRWGQTFGNPAVMGWIIARTAFATVGISCVYISIYLLPIGDSSALKQLATVFIAFLAWALGWESINPFIILGAVACTIGAVLVSHPPFLFGGHEDWSTSRLVGIIVSLCAAVALSFSNLIVGKVGKSTSTLSLMIWFDFAGVVTSIIPLMLKFPEAPVLDPNTGVWLLLCYHTMASLIGQSLLTRGFQLCNATKGSAIQTTIVVYCYVLGYFVLGEPLSYFSSAGTVFVIGGILAVAEGKRRAKVQAAAAAEAPAAPPADAENQEA
ncbi:hypothetical protein BSKO_10740 [Bryopsis sp. KO-2023]|nr:hypothetical protein BSKO_10740 [Bryopsis sp. KO-2023]